MGVDATLGRANVAVRATLESLDGDLAQARGKVDSAVKRIASGAVSNLQTIGTGALAGIGVAAGAVAGLGAALGKITIDAAPVEGIRDAFDGLAQSAGVGGDAMIQALQEGSAGMISQRDLMLSFNKAASLVSTDFAVQLPEAMQYLSKVSASTGQDMGFLMDSLVVGVGRLSPMILDNLGIQVSQAEATARAAEMFGVEAAALDKTQLQAGMMNVALEKLAANTAAMPDVTESANAKLAQMRARFQDVKDQIGMAFLPALSGVLEIVADLADRVLPPLVDVLQNTVAPAIATVVGAFQDFLWMLDVGVAPMDALKIALGQIFGPEVADKIMSVVDGIRTFVDQIWTAIEPVVAWVTENVKLQDVLIALGIAIGVAAAAFLPLLAHVAGIIAVFVAVIAIVAALRTAWETNFLGIRDIGEQVWTFLQTFIPQALETIRTIFNNVVTAIQTFWAEHGATIMAKAQEIWDKVVAIFEWFKGQFTTLFSAFRLAFEGDWRGFGEKLRQYWDEGWAKIKEIGEKAWTAIKDFFRNTDWGSVGRNILEGIAKGISAGLDIIKNAAKRAARAALDAAKGFLGIQSPSKQAADIIGEPFVAGIGAGIEDALPRLRRAALAAGEALLQATQGSLYNTMQLVPQPQAGTGTGGGGTIVIYGLTVEGVQDREGFLAELYRLAGGGGEG
ncbi:MAG: hypothetical protein JXC32_20715 [Anaerolineae bacterium]|nr:hypothetical protein [Anaerolineae bacterium]